MLVHIKLSVLDSREESIDPIPKTVGVPFTARQPPIACQPSELIVYLLIAVTSGPEYNDAKHRYPA